MNTRLNFLIHLHKPLQEMLSVDNTYPSPDAFEKLSNFMSRQRGKERNPHNELLYQVIKTTLKGHKVRANPFNLPMLEVGMYLNDKLIYMSFMQLYQEFQIEWFKSMKDIDPPKFHNQFKDFKSLSKLSSRTPHHQSRPSRRKAGSVISSFGF
uniref:NS n=1 Tax=Cercospora beticola negative-stranded virus 5 TaxID=2973216 RepID=A0A976SHD7_9MONO|nr:NS [Cercospora beticola negative-stranded virus 5]